MWRKRVGIARVVEERRSCRKHRQHMVSYLATPLQQRTRSAGLSFFEFSVRKTMQSEQYCGRERREGHIIGASSREADSFDKNRSNNPNPTTVWRYGFRNRQDRLYSSRSNRSVECGASNPHRGRDPPHGSTAVRDHRVLHSSEAALWGQGHAASSLACLR